MDRYDRIIRDVIDKTRAETLTWNVVPASDYPRSIFGRDRIRRCYKAIYPLAGRNYDLIFTVRSYDIQDEEIGDSEGRMYILYILIGGIDAVVLELDDTLVERDDLYELASLIEGQNDQARNFFEAFESSQGR